MGRTACTEPQCLYKGALYLYNGADYVSSLKGCYPSTQNRNVSKRHSLVQWLISVSYIEINPLNAELNPVCYLLALLAHHFLNVSRIRVKSLTLRLLMSYIYIYIYIWSTYS